MAIENIKVGQKYNFTLLANHDTIEDKGAIFVSPTGMSYLIKQEDYVALSPESDIKNAVSTPKYDPCRMFRKGDIVEPRELHGRKHKTLDYNYLYEVLENEDKDGIVKVSYFDGGCTWTSYIPFYWFNLVTPVEELERYIVIHNKNEKYFDVCWKDDDEPDGRTGRTRCRVTYWYHQPPKTYNEEEAKAEAEAECARLNAEYRKEQK